MDSICPLDLNAVGERIRVCRKKEELSQEELAYLVGVSSNTISSIENGQQNFKIDKLDLLSQILKVTTGFILYGSDEATEDVRHETNTINEIISELDYLSELDLRRMLAGLKASRQVA